MSKGRVLVTGACGFIGSHVVIELIDSGYEVVALGNNNGLNGITSSTDQWPECLNRIKKMFSNDLSKKNALCFRRCNLVNFADLKEIFCQEKLTAVIHLASLKGVADSVANPVDFYCNNLQGTFNLIKICQLYNVKNFVFGSSATVYGTPSEVPIKENSPTGQTITNPYGQSKYMIEQLLFDLCVADKDWSVTILRMFDPAGAHPSGQIGEDNGNGPPKHLVPFISEVATGKFPNLKVFGNKFNTRDGTGERDYVHVVDVAKAHVYSLDHMRKMKAEGAGGSAKVYNIGSGQGYTVLEMASAFEKASERKIKVEMMEPRPGDIAGIYCDASLASKDLNWRAERTIEDICRDLWNWKTQNPKGYESCI
ncbi:NAD dependent epimerase/dehydratase family domain-containing protein [Ditylenchus destructor]|nr:NAD dependent epimerase/dehydratase family domain-containing protein [Ditylenchus destructor]